MGLNREVSGDTASLLATFEVFAIIAHVAALEIAFSRLLHKQICFGCREVAWLAQVDWDLLLGVRVLHHVKVGQLLRSVLRVGFELDLPLVLVRRVVQRQVLINVEWVGLGELGQHLRVLCVVGTSVHDQFLAELDVSQRVDRHHASHSKVEDLGGVFLSEAFQIGLFQATEVLCVVPVLLLHHLIAGYA